uniref:Ricin B lectin domain-containing protein n=1 Tax=Romanomermis culicivorax TaxID=13658 RepID=A0A915I4Q3_ROMCU
KTAKIVPPRTQQLPILVKYTNTKQCKVFHGENQQYVNCKNHGIWGSYYWTNDKLDRCLLIESNSKKSPVDMSNCKFIEKPTKFFYSVKKRQCLRLIKEGTSKIYNTMFECRQDIVGLVTVHICNNAQKTVKFDLHHEQAIVNAKDHKYESNSDYAYLNCNLEKIHYDHEAQDCRRMTKREYKKLGKAKTEQRVSRRLMLNCETEKCT